MPKKSPDSRGWARGCREREGNLPRLRLASTSRQSGLLRRDDSGRPRGNQKPGVRGPILKTCALASVHSELGTFDGDEQRPERRKKGRSWDCW